MSDRIADAARFAQTVHSGQFRKGPKALPYATHCAEVADIVRQFGANEDTIIAGWLHDTVEDTDTTLGEITSLFGAAVAEIVDEVTDDPTLDKAAQRAAQISSAPQKSPGAAMVKAADQMSNMRSIVNTPPYWSRDRANAYIDKASAVVAALPAPATMKAAFEKDAGAARAKAAAFPAE